MLLFMDSSVAWEAEPRAARFQMAELDMVSTRRSGSSKRENDWLVALNDVSSLLDMLPAGVPPGLLLWKAFRRSSGAFQDMIVAA
jgi:hypothetical protein